MSCTQAFDALAGCYSVGGQVKHYYRYGHMNDCVKEFTKFRFCVMNSDPVKVQRWYKEELEEKRSRGSSEDVWSAR